MIPFQWPCVLSDHWCASTLNGLRVLSTTMVSRWAPGASWPNAYSWGVHRIVLSPHGCPSNQTWEYLVRSRKGVTRWFRQASGIVTSRSYHAAPLKRYSRVSPPAQRSAFSRPFRFVSVVPGSWMASAKRNSGSARCLAPGEGPSIANRHSPASGKTAATKCPATPGNRPSTAAVSM
jgi:hypothetical protein